MLKEIEELTYSCKDLGTLNFVKEKVKEAREVLRNKINTRGGFWVHEKSEKPTKLCPSIPKRPILKSTNTNTNTNFEK